MLFLLKSTRVIIFFRYVVDNTVLQKRGFFMKIFQRAYYGVVLLCKEVCNSKQIPIREKTIQLRYKFKISYIPNTKMNWLMTSQQIANDKSYLAVSLQRKKTSSPHLGSQIMELISEFQRMLTATGVSHSLAQVNDRLCWIFGWIRGSRRILKKIKVSKWTIAIANRIVNAIARFF